LVEAVADWEIAEVSGFTADWTARSVLLPLVAAPQGNNPSRRPWTLVRCWTIIGRE